jgi:hypothetical protein
MAAATVRMLILVEERTKKAQPKSLVLVLPTLCAKFTVLDMVCKEV